MQFTTLLYIGALLPLTLVLYYKCNKYSITLGKGIILAASIAFYSYTNLISIRVLAVSLALNFIFSVLIGRIKRWHRLFLFIPVAVNIFLLLWFKYTNFAISSFNSIFHRELPLKDLILPVGISFFTFQQIAYLVAIYRGELQKNNILDYLSYILFFPKILMGPLMDPIDFIEQFNDSGKKSIDWGAIASGIKLFSFGLF